MQALNREDLSWAVRRLPKILVTIMKRAENSGKIFVGGGFLRASIAGEPVNDADVFCPSKGAADRLARQLITARHMPLPPGDASKDVWDAYFARKMHVTDNAITLRGFSPTIQIIHKWNFERPEDVISSFDFTVCCAIIWYEYGGNHPGWSGCCDDRFYPDVAAKRLVYRSPVRIEEAGGSTLRVLKYYQKGYRIPLDQFGAVLARLFMAVDWKAVATREDLHDSRSAEKYVAFILSGLLRTVDPRIDPLHEAHLPAMGVEEPADPESET